jgi:hypothetical protein
MSDIYLQITETPAVVTLSAPVVSGALSSTVTVANTVTVALDANSLSALENVTVTVGAAITGTVTVGNSVTISSLPAISGTVTARVFGTDGYGSVIPLHMAYNDEAFADGRRLAVSIVNGVGEEYTTPLPISGTVTIGSALPAGTNRIGVVTIGAGSVTIGAGTAQIGSVTASISNFPATQAVSLTTLPALVAGTAQIGSVTASISGTVPISISSVTVGNSVTIGSLPALAAGTAQIGSVTASISNTVVTIYSAQGTTVTNSNFTSTTASTTLVSAVAGRDVLTVFNEGAGNLHISPGATATTISYQVRLSAGDYWECPEGQRSLIHTAVFATAGTARVTEVS